MQRVFSMFSKAPGASFQVLSDLHLEVDQEYASFDIPVSASHLILAGDIGCLIDYDAYLGFLVRRTRLFERVFLVLGNHEFYGMSIAAGLEQAWRLEREPRLKGKLVVLHQRQYDIPNSTITILGCTLWSKIPDSAKDAVLRKVQDFKQIHGWTIEDHNAAHQSDHMWLKSQVAALREAHQRAPRANPERTVVVITHYAPSTREALSPWQFGSPWSSAFATELLSGWDWTGVQLWVFGHTHFTTEFKKYGVKAVSNQRASEQESYGKDKKTVYDVGKAVRI
ncbi:hypothetical protein AOQ84DRAFT_199234 [Glonium stellatum]|uniref:Calcineurin-like phosphoesterase domain-containing protein n=1 Tax=Glonium stellatum TaxID=574774 RepID=A0A8E2F6E6_9PEZI|nr:hypothetical protein AOQ84DRAFT_199234 [Glonium stellatum]